MAPNDTDRRRFLLATALTLLALPALWWANKQSDAGAPKVASVGIEVASGDGEGAATPVIASSDPTGSAVATTVPVVPATPTTAAIDDPAPVFLEGPSANAATEAPAVGIPAAPAVPTITARATYRSSISPADTCLVADVATGTRITVTNLDNGLTVTCIATRVYSAADAELVMHTNTFAQIADLTDAPIPVEITP